MILMPMSEWINKRWYIYTMEYYGAVRKNEVVIPGTTWLSLENHAGWEKRDTKGHPHLACSHLCDRPGRALRWEDWWPLGPGGWNEGQGPLMGVGLPSDVMKTLWN